MVEGMALAHVQWEDAFREGEKRITQRFLDAMIQTPARDRARLVMQRHIVQRKIERALVERNPRKLQHAFREQIKLLKRISPETTC